MTNINRTGREIIFSALNEMQKQGGDEAFEPLDGAEQVLTAAEYMNPDVEYVDHDVAIALVMEWLDNNNGCFAG